MKESEAAQAAKASNAQAPAAQAQKGTGRTGAITAATWFARIAFAAVFVINVHCALQFVLAPGQSAAAYELGGVAGEAAVRGIGIAFLMWNATYPAFIVAPRRFKVLGWVILAQQAIGLIGETALYLGLPGGHDVLASSVSRFIAFDGAGLVLMALAFACLLIAVQRVGSLQMQSQMY